VLCHRVIMAPEARLQGRDASQIVDALIEQVPAPVEKGRR